MTDLPNPGRPQERTFWWTWPLFGVLHIGVPAILLIVLTLESRH